MNKLATALLALGFIPVLGTTEACGHERYLVNRGAPKKFDVHNGVIVVYDEIGVPWIATQANISIRQMRELAREHRIIDGAYVPHSNDGGRFIRGNVPSVSAPS